VSREICAFAFYGAAIPKMRAGRNGTQSFTPKRNMAFEAHIRAIGAVTMARAGMAPTPDAVLAEIAVERAIPKSWSKKKALAMRGLPITGRPDIDNLAKAILDALNEVVYEDDAQVSDLHFSRRWGETDCVRVRILHADGPGVLAEVA
jgi:Holliday junction resolvase RusA-like endonuclease